MRCAVERKIADGKVYCESESICQEEAVYAYTTAGAKGITGNEKSGVAVEAVAWFTNTSVYSPWTLITETAQFGGWRPTA